MKGRCYLSEESKFLLLRVRDILYLLVYEEVCRKSRSVFDLFKPKSAQLSRLLKIVPEEGELPYYLLRLSLLSTCEEVQSCEIDRRILSVCLKYLLRLSSVDAELAVSRDPDKDIADSACLSRDLVDQIKMQPALRRDDTGTIRNGAGDIVNAFLESRVYYLLSRNVPFYAYFQLARAAYFNSAESLRQHFQQERIGLHRIAQPYVLTQDIPHCRSALRKLFSRKNVCRGNNTPADVPVVQIIHIFRSGSVLVMLC